MAITIKRFTICMTILLIVCICCMFWIAYTNHNRITRLQFEVDTLMNYRINAPLLKDRIVNLELENTELKRRNEELKITNAANSMVIKTFKSDYLMAISYITVAEFMLTNQGIEFTYLGRR